VKRPLATFVPSGFGQRFAAADNALARPARFAPADAPSITR
jgi:hypothetical protein